nr:helix-turn-helix domain-containing protein [uncultured Arsenicibacter sp.]
MRLNVVFLFCLLWLLAFTGQAQLVIEVVKSPPLLPLTSGLYIAGDFNNWNPGDPAYKLKKGANGSYSITLPDTLKHFEYKLTQGSWMTVEGGPEGKQRPNRVYNRPFEPDPNHIQITVESWEFKPAYRFVITQVPDNTPHDAKIYITGNFNKWNPGDESLLLKRQFDGTYRVSVYTDLEKLEFKFTRGNWDSVEGRENGKARANRVILRGDNINNESIELQIQSWEDLSGTFNFYSVYDLLLLFSAFQGILLIIAIPTIQNYNQAANRWLVILLGLSSFAIFIRIFANYRDVAQSYTKLVLLSDVILFTYGPLFYIYINKLLYRSGRKVRNWSYRFIPAGVQVLIYLPFAFMNSKQFQIDIVNQDVFVMSLFLGGGFAALLFNAGYWLLCRRTIRHYQQEYETSHSFEHNIQYLYTVLTIQAICLVLWATLFLFIAGSKLLGYDPTTVAARHVDAIWLVFSTIIYFLGYFAIHQPEIFKVPASIQPVGLFDNTPAIPLLTPGKPVPVEEDMPPMILNEVHEVVVPAVIETPTHKAEPLPDGELQVLKEQVESYLLRNKLYTNPNLTINELASKLKMQPYLLSKVINEGFDKNFFDFINHYRVEELKHRLDDPRFKNYTLLSLAFEVGFNSKTAFNRAFKKITRQTPSEYMNAIREVA